jgi:hypothetical protein
MSSIREAAERARSAATSGHLSGRVASDLMLLAAVALAWESERIPGLEAERAHVAQRRSGMKRGKKKGRRS